MKSAIIAVLLVAIAYAFGAGWVRIGPERQAVPVVKPLGPPPVTTTTVDSQAPFVEIHPSKAVILRGRVTAIEGPHATVDCDYWTLPKHNEGIVRGLPQTAVEHVTAGRDQAAQRVFGYVTTVDNFGRAVPVDWTPRDRLKGSAVLIGAQVKVGQPVHFIVTPVSSASGMVIYTARVKAAGGRWMWDQGMQNPLKIKSLKP